MKLGVVLERLAGDQPFEDALDLVRKAGLECVGIGTHNYPQRSPHIEVDELLRSAGSRRAYLKALDSRGLGISALSCHGNPLHPRPELAEASHAVYRPTVELAAKLGVPCVVLFSGCPGDSEQARYPNWVTCAWPTEFGELLEWQWREKVIPYGKVQAEFAARHGVHVAVEMHGGFVVYNPATLLRLRDACGETVGANLDPSHLFWQGIDVETAIDELGQAGAIYHVHAKDTGTNRANAARNGVLDTTPLDQVAQRSWLGRTVGYGHSQIEWKRIVMALRLAGYEGVLSIEHEDPLLSPTEGFRKGVSFLREVMPSESP